MDHLSIHDSFSRFVTIHGTHEATVSNSVAYNGHGHGYFLEDGYESLGLKKIIKKFPILHYFHFFSPNS